MFHRGVPDQAQGVTGGGSDGQVTGRVRGSGGPQGQGVWLGGQYKFVRGVIFLSWKINESQQMKQNQTRLKTMVLTIFVEYQFMWKFL